MAVVGRYWGWGAQTLAEGPGLCSGQGVGSRTGQEGLREVLNEHVVDATVLAVPRVVSG